MNPIERFGKERTWAAPWARVRRATSLVTRYAGQVSEPEKTVRLGSGQDTSTLAPEGPDCRAALGRGRSALDSTVGAMSHRETEHLRVLIANERKNRLALVAQTVAALGHEVIAREIDVDDIGAVTARERPDVALVGLGESSKHALELVTTIVHESTCPVIALIHSPDPNFVREASKRGIFAYITDADGEDWQSSIDIVLRRFTEYHDLEGAFGRRAITERAKGILMERHSVDETAAFEMLREHARSTNRKLVDVAAAVVDSRVLLPKQPAQIPVDARADRLP